MPYTLENRIKANTNEYTVIPSIKYKCKARICKQANIIRCDLHFPSLVFTEMAPVKSTRVCRNILPSLLWYEGGRPLWEKQN